MPKVKSEPSLKQASLVTEEFYQQDRIFDLGDRIRNRDGALYFISRLRDALKRRGYALHTNDIASPHSSDLAIYMEMPKRPELFPRPENRSKSWLLIYESELIRPDNWDLSKHEMFGRIFTWNDEFVARKPDRYFKSNFVSSIPEQPTAVPFSGRKLCTLIAGNKSVRHPQELYSARRNFITWAEKNLKGQFEYYGMGWDHSYLRGGFTHKVIRKLGLLPYMPKHRSPSYRGRVDEKNPTLSRYKYSICFENGFGIPGYITEKIFDSMFAGCVPVYWGAPNIADHVPPSCFIDCREFLSAKEPFAALSKHLKSITEERWNQYQVAIGEFLRSPKIQPFSADPWAEMIASHVSTK